MNHRDAVSLSLSVTAKTASSELTLVATQPLSPPKSSKLSAGEKAVTAIGATIGAVVLFGSGYLLAFMMLRKRLRRAVEAPQMLVIERDDGPETQHVLQLHSEHVNELSGYRKEGVISFRRGKDLFCSCLASFYVVCHADIE